MHLIWRNRVIQWLVLLGFALLFTAHQAVPINLTAVDIGRHLQNGYLLLHGQTDILYHNVFTFTYPDYPFINHHWLAGIIFYGVFLLGGWSGLGIFYVGILLTAYAFFYRTARDYCSSGIVLLLSVIAVTVMANRTEIRPEGFSILFMGIYFYVLTRLSQERLRLNQALMWLIPIQLIWVNTHIFFFVGPLLALCFALIYPRQWLLVLSVLGVNLINPSGIAGALTPLNGFKEFGYRLAENQSVWFMFKRFSNDPNYLYQLIFLGLGVICLGLWIWRHGRRQWPLGIFFAVVLLAGFSAVRLMAPCAFIWLILASQAIQEHKRFNLSAQIITGIIIAMAFMVTIPILSPTLRAQWPFGLYPGINQSAEFYKSSGLKGPIFSNYDIGGYLIYHLYPQEKLFVDNRQEAFPPTFFKDVYIPMQEDHAVWAKVNDQYQFNVVYFYRHDLTPWGQSFLLQLIDDPLWAPIYVDGYTIMFARRGSVNQSIINEHELPRDMFTVASQS